MVVVLGELRGGNGDGVGVLVRFLMRSWCRFLVVEGRFCGFCGVGGVVGRIAGAFRSGGRLRGGGRDAWGHGGVLGGRFCSVAYAGPVEELADGLSGDSGAWAAGALGVAVEARAVTCCQIEELELCRRPAAK